MLKLSGGWKNEIHLHFTPKPEKSIERIILSHTKENDIVLDCFMGSGTTAFCAKKLNRNFIGCDENQEFVDFGNNRCE